MATLGGGGTVTLMDVAKRMEPNGGIATDIVELLNQTNEVLTDMTWSEGNLPTGHRVTVRTGLPTATWRLLNNGVSPSKSLTAQLDEQCGMLEAWSEVDADLAQLNGNTAAFRLSEGRAFVEAMNEAFVLAMFYGNSGINPEQFTGLSPRYNSKSATNGASNIIDCSGTGSVNASVWLIGWSDQSIYGIYPKGSQAGLLHEDLGRQVIETTAAVAGNRMMGYRDRWQWKCGIVLKDWRYVVRLCNIDTTNLTTELSNTDLVKNMIKAIHRMPFIRMVRPVFYMNRTVFEWLDIQRWNDVKSGGQLKYEQVDGILQYTFRGIPVRIVDQLLNTEARIV